MTEDVLSSYIIVDKRYVEVGSKFYYNRALECNKCTYKEICLKNKIDGLLYEVIEIKKPVKKTICKITGREGLLAKIRPASILITIPTKDAHADVEILYTPVNCGESRCPYIKYCNNNALARLEGKRFIKIINQVRRVDCPYNVDLILVKAKLTRFSP